MPSLHLRSTFALPPYQSRCKVGAKSVEKRFSIGVDRVWLGRTRDSQRTFNETSVPYQSNYLARQNDNLCPYLSAIIHIPRFGRDYRHEAFHKPKRRYAAKPFSISLQKVQEFHYRRICPCGNGRVCCVYSHIPCRYIFRQLPMLEHLVWQFPWTYRTLCSAHWSGISNPQIHPCINHKHYLSAYQRIDTPPLLYLNRHKRMAYNHRISNRRN